MYDSNNRGKMHNHRSREDIPRKAQTIQFSDAMKEPTVETVERKNQMSFLHVHCTVYFILTYRVPEKYAIQHLMACER